MRTLGNVTWKDAPLTMRESACVVDACNRMRDDRSGSVLVTNDSGRLVGIFTGRDAVCRVLAQRLDAATTRLAEVMTRNPTTMSPEQTAIDALRLMHEGNFRHVPLVRNGRIVGLVSRGDFKGVDQPAHEREEDPWEHMR